MAQIIRGTALNRKFNNSTTLGHLFIETARKYADRISQIDAFRHEKETYSSVIKRSIRLAIKLQTLGVTSEDVILNCTSNRNEATYPIIAAWLLGAKIANFDPIFTNQHVIYLINLIQPKVIFIEDVFLTKIETCLEEIGITPIKIVIGGVDGVFLDIVDTPKPNEDNFQAFDGDNNVTAVMFFTSGTSGLPKAVCHSQKNLIEWANVTTSKDINASSFLHFASLFWISAMGFLVHTFLEGGTRISTSNMDVVHFFQIIEQYKVETVFCAPKITYEFTGTENKYDTSSVTLVITGGNPIPSMQLAKLGNVFPNAPILFGYGMTETWMLCIFNPITQRDWIKQKPNSVGTVVSGTEIKIVDPDSFQTLGPHQKGLICAKNAHLMQGYHQLDSSSEYDADGYLKTGDLGYFDEDHCFNVVDRIKEMFKYLEHHIVPARMQAILLEHPAVYDVIVFGIPDKMRPDLQRPTACIVRKKGVDVSVEEIHAFFDERVSDWERLRGGIIFCKELPRGPSGKLQRKLIISKYMNYFDRLLV